MQTIVVAIVKYTVCVQVIKYKWFSACGETGGWTELHSTSQKKAKVEKNSIEI